MVNMLKNGSNMSVLPDPAKETRNKVKKKSDNFGEAQTRDERRDCKPKQVKK